MTEKTKKFKSNSKRKIFGSYFLQCFAIKIKLGRRYSRFIPGAPLNSPQFNTIVTLFILNVALLSILISNNLVLSLSSFSSIIINHLFTSIFSISLDKISGDILKVHYIVKRLTLRLLNCTKNYRIYYLRSITVWSYFLYMLSHQMNNIQTFA